MKDGLYLVTTPFLCAGFMVENGIITHCAPILKKKIEYWKTVAVWISPMLPTTEDFGWATRAIDEYESRLPKRE